jgi:hypothetical protein
MASWAATVSENLDGLDALLQQGGHLSDRRHVESGRVKVRHGDLVQVGPQLRPESRERGEPAPAAG